MGMLALGIFWVNTLLIAAAALKERAKLVAKRMSLGPVSRGKILRGAGPRGVLAAFEVVQRGRLSAADPPTILFSERALRHAVSGGCLALEDGSEVDIRPSENGEVWVDDATFKAAASCPSDVAFERAALDARKADGFVRTVVVELTAGRDVFAARREASFLLATMDPRVWLARRMRLAHAFVVAEIVVAGACTATALHSPRFGTLSTLGGAASLAFFLIVQPLGTLIRDTLLPPSRARRRTTWARPQKADHVAEKAVASSDHRA
jgi:hypothetical protein